MESKRAVCKAWLQACKVGDATALSVLMKHGADVTICVRADEGRSLIHLAAQRDDSVALRVLFEGIRQREEDETSLRARLTSVRGETGSGATAAGQTGPAAESKDDGHDGVLTPRGPGASPRFGGSDDGMSHSSLGSGGSDGSGGSSSSGDGGAEDLRSVVARAQAQEEWERRAAACHYPCSKSGQAGPNSCLEQLVDVRDSAGMTALHVAVHAGSRATALQLLEAGASVAALCSKGRTPMQYARHEGMATLLLGWPVSASPSHTTAPSSSGLGRSGSAGQGAMSLLATEPDGCPAWHLDPAAIPADRPWAGAQPPCRPRYSGAARDGCQFTSSTSGTAKEEGQARHGMWIRRKDGAPVYPMDLAGPISTPDPAAPAAHPWTWLHVAAARLDLPALNQWMQSRPRSTSSGSHGHSPSGSVDIAGPGGLTPLHIAVSCGPSSDQTAMLQLQMVQALLEAGADPLRADDSGRSSLHRAAMGPGAAAGRSDSPRLVEALIEHVRLVAARHRSSSTSGQRGGQSRTSPRANGNTASATTNGHRGLRSDSPPHGGKQGYAAGQAEDMLQSFVRAVDNEGHTPLHMAALYGRAEVVGQLVRAGADVYVAVPQDGAAALHLCASAGHAPVVKALLRYGARLGATDGAGRTPLHDAAVAGHMDVVRELLAAIGGSASSLQSAILAKDTAGRTPLHDACGNGHEAVALLMISHLVATAIGPATSTPAQGRRGAQPSDYCYSLQPVLPHVPGPVWAALPSLLGEAATIDSSRAGAHGAMGASGVSRRGCQTSPQALCVWALSDSRLASPSASVPGIVQVMPSLPEGSLAFALPIFPTAAQSVAMGQQSVNSLPPQLSRLLACLQDLTDGQGWGIHHEAAAGGCAQVLRLLIQLGLNVAAPRPGEEHHVVHDACVYGRPACLAVLKELCLDLGRGDANGDTPMHWAAFKGNTGCVGILIEAAAARFDTMATNPVTPQTVSRRDLCALPSIQAGPSGMWPSLVAAKTAGWGMALSARNSDGGAPLHSAANSGSVPIGLALLRAGVDPCVSMFDGNTALHNSAYEGHAPFTRLLLQYGAAPDIANEEGRYALHEAAANGHVTVIEALLEGVPLLPAQAQAQGTSRASQGPGTEREGGEDMSPRQGQAADGAATGGNSPRDSRHSPRRGVFSRLLNSAASAMGRGRHSHRSLEGSAPSQSPEPSSATGAAASSPAGTPPKRARANPDVQDSGGDTPLHWAVCNNYPTCTRALLEGGADLSRRNVDGGDPVHASIINNCPAGLLALLDHGADPSSRFSPMDSGWSSRDTALHVAAAEGRADCIRLLLHAGADVDSRSARKRTPLHDAVRSKQRDCVELLLAAGADISLLDDTERTPFGVVVPRARVPALVAGRADDGTWTVPAGSHRVAAVGARSRLHSTPSPLVVVPPDAASLSKAWASMRTTTSMGQASSVLSGAWSGGTTTRTGMPGASSSLGSSFSASGAGAMTSPGQAPGGTAITGQAIQDALRQVQGPASLLPPPPTPLEVEDNKLELDQPLPSLAPGPAPALPDGLLELAQVATADIVAAQAPAPEPGATGDAAKPPSPLQPALTTTVIHSISPLSSPLNVAVLSHFPASRYRAYGCLPTAAMRRVLDSVAQLAPTVMSLSNGSNHPTETAQLDRAVPAAALSPPPSLLISDTLGPMAGMWAQGLFTDVVLRSSDGTDIPAHRMVLASRAEPLLVLLAHGWRESSTSVIQVSMPKDVLMPLLVWAYTGRLPRVSLTVSLALLELADAWDTKELLQASLGCAADALSLPDLVLAFEWASERYAGGRTWAWELLLACADYFVRPATAASLMSQARARARRVEEDHARAVAQWRDTVISTWTSGRTPTSSTRRAVTRRMPSAFGMRAFQAIGANPSLARATSTATRGAGHAASDTPTFSVDRSYPGRVPWSSTASFEALGQETGPIVVGLDRTDAPMRVSPQGSGSRRGRNVPGPAHARRPRRPSLFNPASDRTAGRDDRRPSEDADASGFASSDDDSDSSSSSSSLSWSSPAAGSAPHSGRLSSRRLNSLTRPRSARDRGSRLSPLLLPVQEARASEEDGGMEVHSRAHSHGSPGMRVVGQAASQPANAFSVGRLDSDTRLAPLQLSGRGAISPATPAFRMPAPVAPSPWSVAARPDPLQDHDHGQDSKQDEDGKHEDGKHGSRADSAPALASAAPSFYTVSGHVSSGHVSSGQGSMRQLIPSPSVRSMHSAASFTSVHSKASGRSRRSHMSASDVIGQVSGMGLGLSPAPAVTSVGRHARSASLPGGLASVHHLARTPSHASHDATGFGVDAYVGSESSSASESLAASPAWRPAQATGLTVTVTSPVTGAGAETSLTVQRSRRRTGHGTPLASLALDTSVSYRADRRASSSASSRTQGRRGSTGTRGSAGGGPGNRPALASPQAEALALNLAAREQSGSDALAAETGLPTYVVDRLVQHGRARLASQGEVQGLPGSHTTSPTQANSPTGQQKVLDLESDEEDKDKDKGKDAKVSPRRGSRRLPSLTSPAGVAQGQPSAPGSVKTGHARSNSHAARAVGVESHLSSSPVSSSAAAGMMGLGAVARKSSSRLLTNSVTAQLDVADALQAQHTQEETGMGLGLASGPLPLGPSALDAGSYGMWGMDDADVDVEAPDALPAPPALPKVEHFLITYGSLIYFLLDTDFNAERERQKQGISTGPGQGKDGQGHAGTPQATGAQAPAGTPAPAAVVPVPPAPPVR